MSSDDPILSTDILRVASVLIPEKLEMVMVALKGPEVAQWMSLSDNEQTVASLFESSPSKGKQILEQVVRLMR